MSEEMKNEFNLPLSVNDTYAENELIDSNGGFVLSSTFNSHKLRSIARAVNTHDQHVARIAELEHENKDLRNALKVANSCNRKLLEKLK